MNDRDNKIFLSVTVLAGLAAAWLRGGMMASLENQGLLPHGSLHSPGLLVLTLGIGAFLLLFSRKTGEDGTFQEAFPPSNFRLALAVAGGGVLMVSSLGIPTTVSHVLDFAAGIAMILGALGPRRGKASCPGFHGAVCLIFLLRLIRCFRGWSADPQLHDYVIQMLALVCLMLFALYRANCDAGRIRRRQTGVLGLLALYFSLASLSDPSPAFYLGCALWSLSACPTLGKGKKEAP